MTDSEGVSRNKELRVLRSEIQTVTGEIFQKIKRRMELAQKIGEIKTKLGMDVTDDQVENEIRKSVLSLAHQIGLDPSYSSRLLNLLLIESVGLQRKQKTVEHASSHMDILMRARQIEASGRPMIHLEIGEPDFGPPPSLKDAFADAINSGCYHYTDARGIERLREKLALIHGFTKETVMVTPGGRFGVYASIASMLKPGEEIVVIEPSWPAYSDCAALNSVKVKTIKTTFENQWTPDVDEIERAINDATKMIVLNYPNNPTGKILDTDTIERIVSLAKEHGIYILSDEVYSKYCVKEFKSISEYNYDRSIIVESFSKTYAMTGFRLGYLMSSTLIIKQVAKLLAFAMTSVAEPLQYCALNALETDYLTNVEETRIRLHTLVERLKQMDMSFTIPDGSMYLYPRINTMTLDDNTLVNLLLERGIAVAPGSAFGNSYNKFIRISATQPAEQIEKAMDVLETCLSMKI
ncbi:MAG: aminotransferase class I/II-fold pyridoxal phosphate-dependent enzyme [Nitrososphaeraceae archaeon]